MCRFELLGCLILLSHDLKDKPHSPLLRPDGPPRHGNTGAQDSSAPSLGTASSPEPALSPSERALLSDLARLSDLHIRLRAHATHIAAVHPSARHVLAVEATVLKRDPILVGAYDIVPLTAVVGAFADWPRRFEWLWAIVQYILPESSASRTTKATAKSPAKISPDTPSGSQLINRLRAELQTGYEDVERTARSLVRVAETTWLKQVSAWILYGRLPSFGGGDFFVQQEASTADMTGEYVCISQHLPAFVTPATAASMLFIGRSLVHLRAKTDSRSSNGPKASHWLSDGVVGSGAMTTTSTGNYHLSTQLQELSKLTYPLDGASFARTIAHIRAVLSRTALRKLLPPAKVVDMLQLLRDFYLLGRGEFAMALVEQADETMRSRWQRSDGAGAAPPTTASSVRGMTAVIVKDGEVAAVLARTWAMLGAMHGRNANADQGEEEDEGMELARETLRLVLQKSTTSTSTTPAARTPSAGATVVAGSLGNGRQRHTTLASIASTPFQNLLFSVPASLVLQIPYPLDLVLSAADLQSYSAIHAYLLSIRRAHIRLTGLWKLSSLRRHHPPPPTPPYGGRGRHSLEQVQMLRERYTTRANALRSVWATTSAAIFFLAEIENYLQMDVVVELWDGFQRWLTIGNDEPMRGVGVSSSVSQKSKPAERKEDSDADVEGGNEDDADEDEDIWLAEGLAAEDDTALRMDDPVAASHDPQSLATAHRRYLRRLVRRLLLDRAHWTEPLYALLVSIDQMAALVHRLHSLWLALDLESDAGVVDAFVDLDREQHDVLDALAAAERGVRQGVLTVVGVLRDLEGQEDGRGEEEEEEDEEDDDGDFGGWADGGLAENGLRAAGAYVPRRVGRLDRLLMKLDFGSWGG
ncbi:gamma-tubulin complex component [Sporothrix brasiliensis 5110]|uniref:Spindle pole body component n=1 Tax=Sporothrix brasiliensis 5110 TaxID=1398154 RepID=A0A0C2FCQ7_9PEZI|nr:gamma-tubulin complex component [Sporothrix brasiliensis 5110]KIH88908.1 gamma-tubulin complex component [Sporothrix brasiliensis 5110]